jgi:O-methyltransferase involved in polyketide biosynthesis
MNIEKLQTSVSKTLMIPLAARASEMKRSNPVVRDEKVAEILEHIHAGDVIVDGGEIAVHGILSRTKVIDDEIRKYLASNPTAVILNLGAGLDTRISRIDNSRLKCYDLDLPDVIDLRRVFFNENGRVRFIPKSVLDESWPSELKEVNSENIIIIAEGLLMYFSEEDVLRIFDLLTKHFKGAHMYFDVVHSYFVGKGISSAFLWGLDKAKDIEKLNPNIRLVHSWSTGDLLKNRQPLFLRMMNILPSTRNRSQILHIQL